ncbi:hypothetical protein [Pseudarthrobacter albicanus]|uniref:hypothetical protein n=1 Tax=Pseudarthrobacter albicanus TaxID=2823873 RepID=UPI001BAD3F92|nr:hypothetical protein [Pseudarthrobacter albicanus]
MIDAAIGPKGAGVAQWIAVLLTVINMFMSGHQQLSPEDDYRIIEQVQKQETKVDQPPTTDTPPRKKLPEPGTDQPTQSM